MIGRLRGIILEKQPPLVLLETAGVGYEVHMPMTCFYELPEAGRRRSSSPTLWCVKMPSCFMGLTTNRNVPCLKS